MCRALNTASERLIFCLTRRRIKMMGVCSHSCPDSVAMGCCSYFFRAIRPIVVCELCWLCADADAGLNPCVSDWCAGLVCVSSCNSDASPGVGERCLDIWECTRNRVFVACAAQACWNQMSLQGFGRVRKRPHLHVCAGFRIFEHGDATATNAIAYQETDDSDEQNL